MLLTLQPILGLLVLLGLAWLISEDRSAVDWRIIPVGLAVQFALAFLLLWVPMLQTVLQAANHAVAALISATEAGTMFVFGFLGGAPDPLTNPWPMELTNPAGTFILAFQVLPLILMMTVLSSLLWHWGVLQVLIQAFSWLLRRSLRVGGAIGLSTAANVFVGQIEAPILIRPYLKHISRGELLVVMTGGMATVSGSVMVFYSVILAGVVDNAISHILTASVISAPAAILAARIMIPDHTRTEYTEPPREMIYDNAMDAISRGTQDGIQVMVNVGAMLIVVLALVALCNGMLGVLPDVWGAPVTLQRIIGLPFVPLVWLLGVPWQEAMTAGSLMGTKTILNEVVAYVELAGLPEGALSPRSALIMTYAICGFANIGSIGIMIGGIGGLCPERRSDVVGLAPRALVAGTIATCMTGAVVALLSW